MAVDLEERMTQLKRLNDFIDNSRKKITTILSTLGWDEGNIRQKVCLAFLRFLCVYICYIISSLLVGLWYQFHVKYAVSLEEFEGVENRVVMHSQNVVLNMSVNPVFKFL